MTTEQVKIYSPFAGFQEQFVCSDVDFLVGGSAMGVGKSAGALLMAAEPSSDPNFRMLFLRRNLGDLKAGGGGLDEGIKFYGPFCKVRMADSPRITFQSGAFIDFTHMDNQNEDDVLERVKGWQYSVIYVDEATGFEWSTIRLLMSRNRSQAKWTGKMRLTCNPKRNHWLRKWVDWYLDEQGYPIPERVGIVRYFFVNGEKIEDVVFGDTPEEVYNKCRDAIDRLLRAMKDDNLTYRDFIKTTTFYTGKLSENKALDQSYIGSVAAMGEKQRQANMEACWNVDLDDDMELPISSAAARALPDNEECRNGEKWLTCDLATSGKDNAVFIVWDGLHIERVEVYQRTTPRQNVRIMSSIANRYDIPTSHIIYDATGAQYVADELPDAIAFWSSSAPRGKFRRDFDKLKDECYKRLVEVINSHNMSMSKSVASMDYVRMKTTARHTNNLLNEFVEECSVVQFQELASGKIRLYGKKEMNSKLGKSRSMDLLDPCAMRMRPLLNCVYGEELGAQTQEVHLTEENSDRYISIFDEW